MIERQEIYCHNCGKYVQFDIDMELNGNHVLKCPECGHEHCRVVKDGKITEDRWESRNGDYNGAYTYYVTNVTVSSTCSQIIYNYNSSTNTESCQGTNGTTFISDLWLQTQAV